MDSVTETDINKETSQTPEVIDQKPVESSEEPRENTESETKDSEVSKEIQDLSVDESQNIQEQQDSEKNKENEKEIPQENKEENVQTNDKEDQEKAENDDHKEDSNKESESAPNENETKPATSGWGWSSFYSSFKKATQGLAETAHIIAETSKESAKQYLTQLKEKSEEMIKEIQTEENKAGSSMKSLENQVSLPWEGIEFESVKEDLKRDILELSSNDNTFKIGSFDPNFTFNMNSNIPIILKLRKIDPKIGEARLRLVQTNLLKDEIFWTNYFSHINKIQNKYRETIKEKKQNSSETNKILDNINNNDNKNSASIKEVDSISSIPLISSASEIDDIDIDKQLEEYLHEEDTVMDNTEDLDIDMLEQNLRSELGLN